MTGSERVLKKIKNGAIGLIIGGLLMTVAGIAFVSAVFLTENDTGTRIGISVMFGGLAILGIWVLVTGILGIAAPTKTGVLKKNPDLLKMADELYSNIIYQDQYLLLSPRIIGNSKDPREMAYTDEVFLIYVYTHRTNGIQDQKWLKCETARGVIAFNIFHKKDPEVNALLGVVMQNCRYARTGYTKEGLAYLEQMRAAWKADQEQKKSQLNGQSV